MSTKTGFNKRDSKEEVIEERICNMLEKILSGDSEDEEYESKTTAHSMSDHFSGVSNQPQNFQRNSKRMMTTKEKKMVFEKEEQNYDNMYFHHKAMIHRHKKFNTVLVNNNMFSKNNFNNFANNRDTLFSQEDMLNRSLNISVNASLSNTNCNIPINVPLKNSYTNNPTLFTFNKNVEVDDLINDNFEQVTTENYNFLKGKFNSIIRNQNGSRILQKSLANTEKSIIAKIFDEVVMDLQNLIVDCYGNYFCQKFYQFLSKGDKIRYLSQVRTNLIEISNSSIGTYPLQSIIEQLKSNEEKNVIIEALRNDIIFKSICGDQQGVHVIEKVIVCFAEELIPFIYEFILRNFISMANTSTGLVVTKKIVIHANLQVTIRKLQILLVNNFSSLIQNPFGNYTIQVALDSWNYENLIPIFKLFINKFSKHSLHKYSSNVVEKCLEKGGDYIVNCFTEEVVSMNKVNCLIKSNYGNYVIQKALKVGSINNRFALINNILQNLDKLGDKKLMIKWKHIVDSNIEECIKQNPFMNSNSNSKSFPCVKYGDGMGFQHDS